MKRIYTARDGMEAHFVRSLLEQAGIDAQVMGESLGIARGELPMTQETLPSVWVGETDVEAAQTIVDEYKEGHTSETRRRPRVEPWSCPQCGEKVDGHFDICWKCQTPRPFDDSAFA